LLLGREGDPIPGTHIEINRLLGKTAKHETSQFVALPGCVSDGRMDFSIPAFCQQVEISVNRFDPEMGFEIPSGTFEAYRANWKKTDNSAGRHPNQNLRCICTDQVIRSFGAAEYMR
jgi:hypothetical protein